MDESSDRSVFDEGLIKEYLNDFGGDWHGYCKWRSGVQRPGQAFFNALSPIDQTRIRGTLFDTFYKDDLDSIENTIWFLIP